MGSKIPEQWLKWYDDIMNGEAMNENDVVNEIYAEEDSDSEVGEVQESDYDSNMEQEDDPSPSTQENLDGPTFLGKNKKTKWSKHPPPSSRTKGHNLVLRIPGAVGLAQTAKTHLECFSVFIDDEMINIIVTCTNVKIEEVKKNFQRDKDARLTDSCERNAFIGILYLAGVKHSGRENILELCAIDGTGCEQIYLTMSYSRFRFLCRCIRFDNIHDRHERRKFDKLASIRDIFERFVNHCKSSIVPSSYLTVDEQLIAFRGRCSFRMYMPAKPAKYGLKLFLLVDSKTMVPINLEIYPGIQPDGQYLQSNSAYDVVKRLTEQVRYTNRNITIDRWFTSVPLVLDLLKDKLTVIGSINSNKGEIPPELNVKDRPLQSSIFAIQNHCTLVFFVPKKKKNVLMISSMHHDSIVDKETNKPDIILDYNRTKYGVDIVDKVCTSYDVSRNSRRWPLIFDILNIGGIDMLRLLEANNNYNPIPRRNFLKALAVELTLPQRNACTYRTFLQTKIHLLLNINEESTNSVEEPSRKLGRGRCHLCSRKADKKTPIVCSKCQQWTCKDHQKVLSVM